MLRQDFHALRKKCIEKKILFEDPFFELSEKILIETSNAVKWLRPGEIDDSPEFVIEDFSRFNVKQGNIGDCWFLAALMTLTQNPKLLQSCAAR